ncbi:MAG TPA: hypothetical protein VGY66_16135 [Gemmataceae bacterium]|jgi:hypothetical protein|nr:hypothetical protein [Gemmataceae bacterium]
MTNRQDDEVVGRSAIVNLKQKKVSGVRFGQRDPVLKTPVISGAEFLELLVIPLDIRVDGGAKPDQ